eukprot:2010881-Prymnesium_polylepis.1
MWRPAGKSTRAPPDPFPHGSLLDAHIHMTIRVDNHTTDRRHCNMTNRLSQEINSVTLRTRDTVRPS